MAELKVNVKVDIPEATLTLMIKTALEYNASIVGYATAILVTGRGMQRNKSQANEVLDTLVEMSEKYDKKLKELMAQAKAEVAKSNKEVKNV